MINLKNNIQQYIKLGIAIALLCLIWQSAKLINPLVSQAHAQTMDLRPIQDKSPPIPAKNFQSSFSEKWKGSPFLAVVDTPEKIKFTDRDLFCMAKNIYHEAGNQNRLGKFAIAQVTINRMKHPKYENTVCGVVFAPNQFTWAASHSSRWKTPKESNAWKESKEIAREVLLDGYRIKGMENVIFFHSVHIRPRWKGVKKLVQIGSHVFYNRV